MAPAVSIILNCYNHEPYVAEAVESVLAQTFGDFELILIDNGSTDGSRAILERFDDPRIRRFFHDENLSLSRRLNEGVAAAKGEFVAVLYSDDMMLPDKLERQVALFAGLAPEYGVVYCPVIGLNQHSGARWVYPSLGISGPMMPAILRHHFDGGIDMSSPLIRRVCLLENRWHEDVPLDGEAVLFRIALLWNFYFDPNPTVILRDTGSNWGKAIVRNVPMIKRWVDRLAEHPQLKPEWVSDLRRFRALVSRNAAWSVLRTDGDRAWARRELAEALLIYPRLAACWRTPLAMALALAPSLISRRANQLIDRVQSRPENRNLVG
jgi:glycosyltransferase involved in cell wall biosynthesis